jgi:anthranilate synthase/aminodeoxychorismate synthase-like glutamine amidotransferase
LGHQAITVAYGGKVIRAPEIKHGVSSPIYHEGEGIFASLSNPFAAARYHSLLAERESLPAILKITAQTQLGLIMGIQHQEFPIYGVQFHPESILSPEGPQLLKNFLQLSEPRS